MLQINFLNFLQLQQHTTLCHIGYNLTHNWSQTFFDNTVLKEPLTQVLSTQA